MKQIIKKIAIIFLMIIVINFVLIISCHATSYNINSVDVAVELIVSAIGLLVAILTLPLRIIAILAGYAINALTSIIAYVDGATPGNSINTFITPFDIFFNKVNLFDINFFDIKNNNSIVDQMRISVAGWYFVMRSISAAILLVILLYVGIRMAISTVASDRALYKKMLTDWAASLALIFILQYIIIFVIAVNNSIVNAISIIVNSEEVADVLNVIAGMAVPTEFSLKAIATIFSLDSIAATIIFCMLVWQTVGLVFSYFNRMLKIAFLIIISPLISLTYSIDKMGDGKAQALETWLKEFVFSILIQPFHCVIYMCFIDAAFDILVKKQGIGGITNGGGALAASIMAILCVRFVKEGEKIVRKIFAFKDDDSATSLAGGLAAAGLALNQAKNVGKTAKATAIGAKNFAQKIVPGTKAAVAETLAAATAVTNIVKSKEDRTTFAQRKENIQNKMDKASATIRNNGNDTINGFIYSLAKKSPNEKRMKVKDYLEASKQKRKDDVKKEKERLRSKNPTLSEDRLDAMAELNVAKKNGVVRKTINGARGALSNTKVGKKLSKVGKKLSKFKNSETAAVLADISKMYISGGVGLMVGSGVYGTNGNIATAITAGAATVSGTSEFLKNSSKTSSDGIKRNLDKISEMKDSTNKRETAEKIISDISDNKDKYDMEGKGKDKLKELLQEIVKEAGLDNNEQFSQRIDTTIKNVQNSPSCADSAINDFISDVKASRTTTSNKKEFSDAETALSDFGNKIAISQQLQSAESASIDTDMLKERIVNTYSDDESSTKNDKDKKEIRNEIVEEISNMEDISDDVDGIYDRIKGYDDADFEEVIKKLGKEDEKLEKEDKKLEKKLAKKNNWGTEDELETLSQKAQKAHETVAVKTAELIERRIAEQEIELENIGRELALEYQKRLDKAIEAIDQRIGKEERQEVKEELQRTQQRFTTLKEGLERQNIYKDISQ